MEVLVTKKSTPISKISIPGEELLPGMELFIGRSDDCHLVLDDQMISRHHAVIRVRENGIFLSKLAEIGQLKLNGIDIKDSEINLGDNISIGDYGIILEKFDLKQIQRNANLSSRENADQKMPEEFGVMPESSTDLPKLDEVTKVHAMSNSSDDDLSEFEERNDVIDDNLEEINDLDTIDASDDYSPTPEPGNSFSESTDELNPSDANFSMDDSGFGGENFDDMQGGFEDTGDSTQVFTNFATYYLSLSGKNIPFDKYKIEEKETFIGRDPEKCQINLNDEQVSSKHAVIKKSMVNCIIEDLNSSNGTKVNGERVNSHELVNGDIIEIGPIKMIVKISSDLIEAEKDQLMPVDLNQEVEVEELIEEEVDFAGLEAANSEVQEKSFLKRVWKDPKKKRILIFGVVGLLLLMLLTDDEQTTSEDGKAAEAQVSDEAKKMADTQKTGATKKELDPATLEELEANYQVAVAKHKQGEYGEVLRIIENQILPIAPDYKETQTLFQLATEGVAEQKRIAEEQRAEQERQERNRKVQALLKEAREAVKERNVVSAEAKFTQILLLDPENIEVSQLKLEIDAYKKQQEEKRLEEERIKARRKALVDALKPGKSLFLKEEWFQAINELEKFSEIKDMDEDLLKEATDMIQVAKVKLSGLINPLLGKARSFKEGQDLKQAYETYGEVLRYDSSQEEALNERSLIKSTLDARARKLYREALISESLSLFEDASDKLREVQQVAPINSEYYNKATEKLKDYLE